MNTTISADTRCQHRTYVVRELAPRVCPAHVGNIAAVSRSAGSVHITMTDAAAEDLATELSWSTSQDDPGDDMWSQIARDLLSVRDFDTEMTPPSKWQASIIAGFDGAQSSSDVVFATVLRKPYQPKKHRAELAASDWPTAETRNYVPRHAKTHDEIEASR